MTSARLVGWGRWLGVLMMLSGGVMVLVGPVAGMNETSRILEEVHVPTPADLEAGVRTGEDWRLRGAGLGALGFALVAASFLLHQRSEADRRP